MPAELARGPNPKFPVAKPAAPPSGPTLAPNDDETETRVLTAESVKSWATSLSLHAVVLVVMALWYFSPKTDPPRIIDTRLAGSDMGVENGLTLTGGLNDEVAMSEGLEAAPELTKATSAAAMLDLAHLTRDTEQSGAEKATGGGGLKSNNPGAGNGDGFGLARFGSGGENIHGVEVKVGDPQFTLIWDADVDLDLHVIEPPSKGERDGKEIFWEDPKGKPGLGGELDVDNTKGFGPENIYWLKDDGDAKIPGPGPPGDYKWFVVYWGGFGGIPKQSHWKVRIKHDGKVTVVTGKLRSPGEKSRVYTLKVAPRAGADRAANDSP